MPPDQRTQLLSELTDEELVALDFDWRVWARPNQLAPPGDWSTWVVLAGRGFGKTRIGAEWIRENVEGPTPLSKGKARHIALVGEDKDDVKDVMIEGVAGILPNCPPSYRPTFIKKDLELTWPNGAKAKGFSGADPESLRGPQHDLAWADEFAKWQYPQYTWDMLQFGLRLGRHPQQLVTTTPKPIRALKDILSDPSTIVTRGSTYDNRANLAPSFFDTLIRRYEGTRLGRQELKAELLEDNPDALWQRTLLDRHRVAGAPGLVRIVVGVDPPSTSGDDADECGIVVSALGSDGHGYVLGDYSVQGLTPAGWATAVARAFHRHQADRVIAETNQGGDMVVSTLQQVDAALPIRRVHALRGKVVRAEPISALYEQGRVHHVGLHATLEDQMCEFTNDFDPDKAQWSPDRVDALVYSLTELMLGKPSNPRVRSA